MATIGLQADEAAKLEAFPRQNRETGSPEEIRLTVGEFNGKLLVSARVWFQARRPEEGDDGWRPTKVGFTIREHELGRWITGLEVARQMIYERGGSPDEIRPVRQPARERPTRPMPARQPMRPSTTPNAGRTDPKWSGSSDANFDEFGG